MQSLRMREEFCRVRKGGIEWVERYAELENE